MLTPWAEDAGDWRALPSASDREGGACSNSRPQLGQEAKKKKSAPSAPTLSPKISIWRRTSSKTLGGLGKGGGGGEGVWNSNRPPPLPLTVILGDPIN